MGVVQNKWILPICKLERIITLLKGCLNSLHLCYLQNIVAAMGSNKKSKCSKTFKFLLLYSQHKNEQCRPQHYITFFHAQPN